VFNFERCRRNKVRTWLIYGEVDCPHIASHAGISKTNASCLQGNAFRVGLPEGLEDSKGASSLSAAMLEDLELDRALVKDKSTNM
jgi:hypothetical protein